MATGLIVGAGAIENAWAPVTRALQSLRPELREGAESVAFANLIYQLRWIHGLMQDKSARAEIPRLSRAYEQRLRFYRRLKRAIAKELRQSENLGELRVRRQFREVVARFVPSVEFVITTNWDRTLDRFLAREYRPPVPRTVHIHGECDRAESLYLPSEVIEEPYRTSAENKAYGALAGLTMKAFEKCERLVIYGVSYDPLDAELGLLTADAFHGTKNPREVVIVDRRPKVVAVRIRTLLGDRPKIRCYAARATLRRLAL